MTETIHVNFSDDEKKSEGVLYEAVPTGEYKCKIVKVELRKVKEGDNKGKPWWNIQLQCIEGKYLKRTLFASVMLFTSEDKQSAHSLSQLLRAAGHVNALASGQIPPGNDLIAKEVIALVQRKKDTYGWEPGQPIEYKNNVTGFKSVGAISTSKGSSGLLPGS